MINSESRLDQLLAEELEHPAPPAARELCNAILERHGEAVSAVLFYGSCLRKNTPEGVLDFYVLVDRYRDIYASSVLAWANAVLPPNVFYLEVATEAGTLRTKYAVISLADFESAVQPGCLHAYIWARFSQPALLVFARDRKVRDRIVRCTARAVITLVQRLGVFLPAQGRTQRFTFAALWQEAFRRTYGAELRTERPEAIRRLYDAASERYDEVASEALFELVEGGWLERFGVRGNAAQVQMDPLRRKLARVRWHVLRPIAKLIAFARLLKSATTFGDWLPYALWKLERHTGICLELTPRQQKRPLVFGWPVLFRLFRQRALF